MTDAERIKSILAEIEHGYIGYDNLHGDNEHGLKVIREGLLLLISPESGPEKEQFSEKNEPCRYYQLSSEVSKTNICAFCSASEQECRQHREKCLEEAENLQGGV